MPHIATRGKRRRRKSDKQADKTSKELDIHTSLWNKILNLFYRMFLVVRQQTALISHIVERSSSSSFLLPLLILLILLLQLFVSLFDHLKALDGYMLISSLMEWKRLPLARKCVCSRLTTATTVAAAEAINSSLVRLRPRRFCRFRFRCSGCCVIEELTVWEKERETALRNHLTRLLLLQIDQTVLIKAMKPCLSRKDLRFNIANVDSRLKMLSDATSQTLVG